MASLGTAQKYQTQAEEFERQGDNGVASDLYKSAARHYLAAGQTYQSKYCLGKHFVRRAFSLDDDDPAAAIDLYEKGIETWNIALSAINPDSKRFTFTLGNIRYIEGVKFSREAQFREKLSDTAGTEEEKVMKMALASACSLSAARAKYDSAQMGKSMMNLPVYYNRMGSYHFNRSECYRYLARIQEMLMYIRYGLTLIRNSLRELTEGIEFFDKSYNMARLPSTAENRTMMLDAATDRERDFQRMKAKLPFDHQPPDTEGMPKIKFTLNSGLDLMENLYSPILLILENAGEVWAKNLSFKLTGDFSGEKEVAMEALPPHSEQLVTLSMAPNYPGQFRVKAELSFRSSTGRSYIVEDEKDIPVLSCRQKRGTGGIIMKSSYLKQKRLESMDEKDAEDEGYTRKTFQYQKIQCPHCGQAINARSLTCPFCQTDIYTKCPKCKTMLPLLWEMCPNCGKWNTDKNDPRGG